MSEMDRRESPRGMSIYLLNGGAVVCAERLTPTLSSLQQQQYKLMRLATDPALLLSISERMKETLTLGGTEAREDATLLDSLRSWAASPAGDRSSTPACVPKLVRQYRRAQTAPALAHAFQGLLLVYVIDCARPSQRSQV
ncbi:hypothetical protein JX265_012829 [Neoarthrinium moseri]|uniref:Uncharacterized protein n=1 Tax=Neoarthrinium moseri TaxID=1658444 RepID=A0A9Q0AJ84_9PEZI|nr:hypothetical protein JX266_005156 [Neoarthrinium moseri]KAI1853073.1 hypothetical protein JX265_012829 [Neoarthrinium moseri]